MLQAFDARFGIEPDHLRPFSIDAPNHARELLSSLPGFKPTPCVELPHLAKSLGVGAVCIKDESCRMGLQSFKALGGAYAVAHFALKHARSKLGRDDLGPADFSEPAFRDAVSDLVVSCASDGNHGRSVAFGARFFGLRAIVYLHEGVSSERSRQIEALGAEVRRVEGTYDDSVDRALEEARSNDWLLLSDTSWGASSEVPLLVMQGYTVLAEEAADEALRLDRFPTHVFLQAGVGGFAASISAYFAQRFGDKRPKIVIAEPERAACIFASAQAGHPIRIPLTEPTLMSMLECYAPSPVAFEILQSCADFVLTVSDDEAAEAMKRLAYPREGDRAIVAGESGAAGLAGLIKAMREADLRDRLGLDSSSQVLLVNTEGATDEASYERLVGCSAEAVLARTGRL